MSHDYSVLLYDPVYGELGVPATLTVGTMAAVEINVIDDTRPKTNSTSAIDVRSVGPGAFAHIPELTAKGIARANYDGSTLTFNGRTWIVLSNQPLGSPNGEDLGEVRFQLKAGV